MRLAVRAVVASLEPRSLVLAAVSGGADSLALLAGLAWEGPRAGLRVGAVHVDHGLRPGSGEQARRVAETATALGCTEVHCVEAFHDVGPDGPEGSARAARYAALDALADARDAALVLTGHTRDDQAESVLLGLVRGSGGRSLAGIPPRRGRYARPLLHLGRDVTVAACAAQGLTPWTDPSNADTALLRNKIRHEVLPGLEAALGPGVAESLARTAHLLREDTDALDDVAAAAGAGCQGDDGSLECPAVEALPAAVRSRVLRRWLLDSGVPGGSLAYVHLRAVDDLVVAWRGQAGASLPGGLVAVRRCDTLTVESTQA